MNSWETTSGGNVKRLLSKIGVNIGRKTGAQCLSSDIIFCRTREQLELFQATIDKTSTYSSFHKLGHFRAPTRQQKRFSLA